MDGAVAKTHQGLPDAIDGPNPEGFEPVRVRSAMTRRNGSVLAADLSASAKQLARSHDRGSQLDAQIVAAARRTVVRETP